MIMRSAVLSWRISMCARGSPSTSNRSASAPAFTTPSSPGRPMSSPPSLVAAKRVSIGEKPRILTKTQRSFAYVPCGVQREAIVAAGEDPDAALAHACHRLDGDFQLVLEGPRLLGRDAPLPARARQAIGEAER